MTKIKQPLVIQYTNLLHKYRSPESKQVLAFLKEHEKDEVFQRRAQAMNKVWRLAHPGE